MIWHNFSVKPNCLQIMTYFALVLHNSFYGLWFDRNFFLTCFEEDTTLMWFHIIFGSFLLKKIHSVEISYSLLSLRFYVKSILEILEVQNLPFWHFYRLLILIFMNFCIFLKAGIFLINKHPSPDMSKNSSFCTSRIPKIDFT